MEMTVPQWTYQASCSLYAQTLMESWYRQQPARFRGSSVKAVQLQLLRVEQFTASVI